MAVTAPTAPARPTTRMARRLFALFVAAAVLPLALSDLVAGDAVRRLAERLEAQAHQQATRHASRQVLDRLITAGALLSALPHDWVPSPAGVPGLGSVFAHLTQLDAEGRVAWSGGTGDTDPEPLDTPVPADAPALRLITEPMAGTAPVVRLQVYREGLLRWQARLAPAFIWSPLDDSTETSRWHVRDALGRTLMHRMGGEGGALLADAGTPAAGPALNATASLFLQGQFSAGAWSFEHEAPPRELALNGLELWGWLALVALGTILCVALVAHWRIRRIFVPLEQLTAGSRALASGAAGARVAVDRDDEIGTLAGAFNDMAERIESQFSALRAHAAIDHDILSGAPLARMAERVTAQLATHYPGASISLAWMEGAQTLGLCLAGRADVPGVMPGRTEVRQLTPAEAARFQAWPMRDRQAPHAEDDAPPGPWLPAALAPGLQWVAHLPMHAHGRAQALLSLGLAGPLEGGALQPALELRDRLAVAFAARAREAVLEFRAAHDSLTGLANRDGLHAHLDRWFEQQLPGRRLALLFLDLDHFKDVNDSQGHEAGDAVLMRSSERLRASVPATALVARQGGDEFVVVLPDADAAEALDTGARLMRSLAQPLLIEGGTCQVGASVGVALCPEHGSSRAELLRRADIALYAAKAGGRGRCQLFEPALDQVAQERVQLLAELRLALVRREMVLHFQPRVRADSGAISSAEALVRWQHPVRGLLAPAVFIELAESSGLIDELGRQVLESACAQAAAWRREGLGLDRVSVNVSPGQLATGDLPATVKALLQRHGLPARCLELEITESLLVRDAHAAQLQLASLREAGVTIALDDFGTGYSSLSVLRQLPIDVMKIDRAFVADLDHDRGAEAIARAIVSLAGSLGLGIVAEGVETGSHAERLRALGCHELQGFHFSRPLPAERFAELPGLRRVPLPA
jgi:diguanylate cyclase (GGDEF)-like protein